MKKLFTLVFALCAFVPFASFSQCSGQYTITYPSGTTTVTTPTNNGSGNVSATFCPAPGPATAQSLSVFSASASSLVLEETVGTVTTTIGTATLPNGSTYVFTLPATTSSVLYTLTSSLTACQNPKPQIFKLTLAPTLTLASSAPASGVCYQALVTLTAAGSTSGTYTWSANGVVISGQTGSSIQVNPTATTTYTVSTTTSCGTSSQEVTVTVKTLSISPNAPFACSGQATTITASYNGNSATYSWNIKGQPSFATTPAVTVTPTVTTTYQVTITTSDCGTITKEVTVTIGTPTVSVTPTAATVCSGSPTTLRATSNNPNAVFNWSPSTGLNTTTGSTVIASPTTSTTYTVTANTTCGNPTATVALTVAAPTFSVNPTSAAICAGASTTLTAGSNITGATYAWYNSADLGTLLSRTASLTVVPATTTTYRVLTTTPCGNNSQDVTVTVRPVPNVTIIPTAVTIFRGASTTLTASGAATYSWSPATGLNTTSGATVVASPTTTTTYTVTGTNATGCSSTNQVTVTVSNPLPVELMTFTARSAGPVSVLNWATATEYNNDYFTVERSADGLAFALLGQVAGAGTSSSLRSYSFTDERPPVAVAYYRLRQVDYVGAATYSPVVSVTSIRHPGDWLVRTALARHYLIQGALDASSRFTVLDVMGRNVFGQAVAPDRAEVVIPALPAGVYLFQLSTQQGRFTVRQSVTAAE